MYKYDTNEFMSNLYEGVYIVDRQRKIVFWNSGSEIITGYKAGEVINSHCYQNILKHVDKSGKKLCFESCPLQNTLTTGNTNENDVFLEHKSGYRVPVSVKTFPLYDNDKNIVAAVEVFTDNSFRKSQYEENLELKKIMHIDELTGLYNRKYLEFQLNNSISEAKEFNNTFGILFIDIDHFKNINDTYGHNTGDGVLQIVANTIRLNLRPEDIIGRWGGEEFIAIIKADSTEILMELAERIRQLVENSSYKKNNLNINVTISLGGTIFNGKDSLKALIEKADKNMYISKHSGRNKITLS
ncbi:MAG: GGDEF domain-containing protein [Candidatus Izemoplasmatales bacterium]|nr:GGDEF domain-containing protein [Candidatus Izemoplasmatales bacterium]